MSIDRAGWARDWATGTPVPLETDKGVTIYGTAGNDVISAQQSPSGQPTATPLGDTLYGYGGNDSLDGSGGADSMYGGTGDDTYYVDQTGDTAFENANEGVRPGLLLRQLHTTPRVH